MRSVTSWLLGAIAAVPLGAFAQAPAQPPAPPAQTAPTAPPPAAAQTPPTPAPAAKDDEFVPTQQLSADEAVTFPVDI
jgi:hypothetical protein